MISKKIILDWLVIILEITYSMSILMQVFFIIPGLKPAIALLLFAFVMHIIRFGFRFNFLSIIAKDSILILFFLIFVFDILQSLIFSDFNVIGLAVAQMFNYMVFLSYLCNIYKENRSLKDIIMPYIGLSLYTVVSVVILALLIIVGLPWEVNMLMDNVRVLEEDISGGGTYYFPYFISLAADYHHIRIFGQLPGITGFFHEPHVIMFFITPALLLWFLLKPKKNIIMIMLCVYFFIALNSMSSFNMVCITITAAIQALWMTRDSKNLKYLLVLSLMISIAAYVGYEIMNNVSLQILSKFGKGDSYSGSLDYSSNMLKYIVSFDSLLGYGNRPPTTGEYIAGVSAGVLTGVLDVLLLLMICFRLPKLIFSSSYNKHYLGLSITYFVMHGMKCNYLLFSYPLFLYILYILTLSTNTKLSGNNNIVETI